MTLLLLVLPALAAGDDVDIELVRPTFTDGALIGGDAARLGPSGALRVGSFLMYERDPLLLYQYQTEEGAVVANRQTVALGFSWQPIERLSLRATLPVVGQWGSEVPALSGDGFGVGDLSVGTRIGLLDRRVAAIGGSVDLYLPTGTDGMWLGEPSMRAEAAALADLDVGPLGVRGELGTTLRAPVDTTYDLLLGSEVNVGAAVVYTLLPERFRISTGLLTRTSYTRFFEEGESVVEWLAGSAVAVAPDWWLDVGVGRGLTPGYGTTQARLMAGLTWTRTPAPPAPAPPPEQRVVVTEAPVDLVEAEPPPDPPPVALAEIRQDRIVIRDPIQFEFGTDRILPVSMPTLEAMASLLAEHPEVLHLVIEGHASEEGSFVYNYELSLSRALAIFRALVEVGVHPTRLSCRAMGEVVPVVAGTDEASLATNRRVVFHIVRRLEPGEAWPDYGRSVTVPWSGATRDVPPPPPPVPAPAAPVVAPPPAEDVPDFRDALDADEPDETSPEPAPPAPGGAP